VIGCRTKKNLEHRTTKPNCFHRHTRARRGVKKQKNEKRRDPQSRRCFCLLLAYGYGTDAFPMIEDAGDGIFEIESVSITSKSIQSIGKSTTMANRSIDWRIEVCLPSCLFMCVRNQMGQKLKQNTLEFSDKLGMLLPQPICLARAHWIDRLPDGLATTPPTHTRNRPRRRRAAFAWAGWLGASIRSVLDRASSDHPIPVPKSRINQPWPCTSRRGGSRPGSTGCSCRSRVTSWEPSSPTRR
jgi:hypothetical protein